MMKPIQVIVGEFSGRNVQRIQRLGWGRCFVDRLASHKVARPYWGEPWILDNGAWPAYQRGRTLDDFGWWQKVCDIELDVPCELPEFAVLPDIVAGGMASLELSKSYLPREGNEADEGDLPRDWTWYLAVQDGISFEAIEELLSYQAQYRTETGHQTTPEDWQVRISGLFLGGTDEFKQQTGERWARIAKHYGLRIHYGRCSSVRKLRQAIAWGYDSCDSTQMLWTMKKFVRFARAWLNAYGLMTAELETWLAAGAPVT